MSGLKPATHKRGARPPGPSGQSPPRRKGGRKHKRPHTGDSSHNGVAMLQPKEEHELWVDLDGEDEEDGALSEQFDAVVKVTCTHTEPNYSLPWQRKRQFSSSSTGFAIKITNKERWLLTNAHSVEYSTQVKVKKRGDDRSFLAKVLSMGVECDIALLSVEDAEFWEDLRPLQFGPLPRLQDYVAVVGYPVGGDTISVTAGVVSRIEVTEYSHGATDLLGVQIDAAINGGNSGGPVFNKRGQCVGIAFQALHASDVENVGYIIPTPVVNHFLMDYSKNKRFTGFPALGIQWQKMNSKALRNAYKMTAEQKGILVRRVNPTSRACQVLRPDDVMMTFDGVQIATDGTVPFRTGERISFSYLISNKYVGDSARLKLYRNGEAMTVDVRLAKARQLIPSHLSNRDPSYFIVAGLVFTVCNEPYLESEYGEDFEADAPVQLLDKMYHAFPERERQEVVILSQVLASDALFGYEDTHNVQVKKFNGTAIDSLKQLVTLVLHCNAEYMRFDLDYDEVVIVETRASQDATRAVLASHNISSALSPDLEEELAPYLDKPYQNI